MTPRFESLVVNRLIVLRKARHASFYFSGLKSCKLLYKKENSTLEEDFFVRDHTSLIPVEVKATNNHAKSLATLVRSKRYADIQYGIKFCGGNVGVTDEIYTFPYYCAFLLRRYLKGR